MARRANGRCLAAARRRRSVQRYATLQPNGPPRMEPGLIARLGLKREEVRSVLEQLAFTVHERQEGQQARDDKAADISRDELWEGLKPLAGGYDRASEVTEYIQTRAGLLQAQERFTYSFPHRTFQEFLAAAHVWSLPEDPVEALYKRLARDTAVCGKVPEVGLHCVGLGWETAGGKDE